MRTQVPQALQQVQEPAGANGKPSSRVLGPKELAELLKGFSLVRGLWLVGKCQELALGEPEVHLCPGFLRGFTQSAFWMALSFGVTWK